MGRVFSLLQVGRNQEALQYAEHIIQKASVSHATRSKWFQSMGYAFRGSVLRSIERLSEAAKAIDTALRIDADNPLALFEKGWLYNHTGDYKSAVQYLERSYRLNPGNSKVPFELGFAYNALGDYNSAIAILSKAIEKYPDNYIH